MAGNRAVYNRAMEQSREAARSKRWDDALRQAALAMQEFPQDSDARTAVAVSLYHTGKLTQAQRLLQELRASNPNNPFYLEFIARTYDKQGETNAAIDTYQTLVTIYQQQRDNNNTMQSLRELLRLAPQLDDRRKQYIHLLEESHAFGEAAKQHMILAAAYQQQGDLDTAAHHADETLRLDPENRTAKELLVALRSSMAEAAGYSLPETTTDHATATGSGFGANLAGIRSNQFVLERMVSEAASKQEAGDIEGAIEGYEEVIAAGLERADVLYSLGLIYQEQGSHARATPLLTKAADDPDYALSAHYALGESYRTMNDLPRAAQEFEQAIGMVDVSTIGRSEADDLIAMYEQTSSIYQQLGDLARAASLYSTLSNVLHGKRWAREQAEEFRLRAKELTDQNMLAKLRSLGGTGTLDGGNAAPMPDDEDEQQLAAEPERWGKIPSIMDYIRDENHGSELLLGGTDPLIDSLHLLDSLPAIEAVEQTPLTNLKTDGLDEKTTQWVKVSGRYTEQGFLDAAMDACYEVMELAPTYYPIHLRMGEILERNQMVEEAIIKYQTLVDTFSIRGELDHAIDVYLRLVQLSPDNINARSRLADLLHQSSRTDEAAVQLSYVADHYFRIGQTSRTLEEYRRGLTWAPNHKELRARYGFTLFRMGRYEAALSEFHRAADPDDALAIAHINMALVMIREQPDAIWDSLAALLAKTTADQQTSSVVQTEYRNALSSADDPLLHYVLAIIQQHSNQHTSALLELEQAQALIQGDVHPLLPPVLVHQALAESYVELEQTNDALEQLRLTHQYARQQPDTTSSKHKFARPLTRGEVVWLTAEAYAAGGDPDNAEKALREALRLMPGNQTIYIKLADVAFSRGKLDEALQTLNDLADYHEGRQNLDKAIEVLEHALKLSPNNIDSGARLARLYLRRGYPDRGVEGLMRVAELQRKDGRIKDALATLQQAGEIRWMQSKPDETLAIYDRIVQIAPNDVEARQWRALMYTLAGRNSDAISEKKTMVQLLSQRNELDNAIAELHQIIALDQQDAEAYYLLGDLLMRRGEYTQAVNLFNRMKRLSTVDHERVSALLAAANRMLTNQQVSS